MIQKIKSENNRNGRDHLTLFRLASPAIFLMLILFR